MAYRDAGLSLEEIARLLSGSGNKLQIILLKRLNELNNEIITIKARQAAVIGIIQSIPRGNAEEVKKSWQDALDEAGIAGNEAVRLHSNFEEHSPKMHFSFLQALGFTDSEIAMIQEYHGKNCERNNGSEQSFQ